jgi:hypothetical protein
VDLWALDEVHFQQQGSRCRMWVPPATRDPVVYHHPTRKSVGYFAAVRLRDGEFLFRRETGRFQRRVLWGVPHSVPGSQCRPPRADHSATTRHIIGLNSIWNGAVSRLLNSAWTSCLLIARNSIPSNESGSLRVGCACTIVTSDFWKGLVAAVEDQFAEWTKPNDTLRRLCAII